ncbi:hypothetical protein Q5P01_004529 [Channa striata]|uniref:Uncharacterized protein n=1 Tax=Channa striata TaxID=64152 RepID=A0AA88NBE1_CHASR|nr:hypothetical protein Q5P01_004529 [Channa striata]
MVPGRTCTKLRRTQLEKALRFCSSALRATVTSRCVRKMLKCSRGWINKNQLPYFSRFASRLMLTLHRVSDTQQLEGRAGLN